MFVLTHRLREAPGHPGITFLQSGVEEAVATAQQAAADKNLEIFGANLASRPACAFA